MKMLTVPQAAAHMLRCAAAAAVSADAFGRAVWLAQASARVRSERFWPHLQALHNQFLTGRRHPIINGEERREFFSLGAKWDGMCYNWNNRADLRGAALTSPDAAEALTSLTKQAKWLSTVKGGFVLQLTRNELGCIDSVNKRLYGVAKVPASVAPYVALCDSLGNPESLWAIWCNAVALERGADPVALSEAHATFVETGRAAPVVFGR